jgi:hypothetical protein
LKRKRWAAAALCAVAALAALDVRLQTVAYSVATPKVAAPVRLAVLSDLHSCVYGPEQRTLLEAVAAAGPDAVLMAGDMVDDAMPEEPAWTAVRALAEEYPCFYVTGNHEWRTGEAERICREMENLGIRVLRGDGETVELNGQRLDLWGVDDPDSGALELELEQAGAGVRKEAFSVLLAHRPEKFRLYLQYPFDLVVSGHAHGGQWRLPGLVNGLFAPGQGLFPAYAGGCYEVGKARLAVSRGLARESTRIPRLFNRPEVTLVEILPES